MHKYAAHLIQLIINIIYTTRFNMFRTIGQRTARNTSWTTRDLRFRWFCHQFYCYLAKSEHAIAKWFITFTTTRTAKPEIRPQFSLVKLNGHRLGKPFRVFIFSLKYLCIMQINKKNFH